MSTKLYRVTFETEVLVASEHDDELLVREQVWKLLRRHPDLREEIADVDSVVSVKRMRKGDPLPGQYEMDMLPWGFEDDRTIRQLLEDEP